MSATTQDHCRACHAPIYWALYEKEPHKPAPLVKPKEGEKPNIEIYTKEDGKTYYRFTPPGEGSLLNHFGNCSQAARFRSSPKGDK